MKALLRNNYYTVEPSIKLSVKILIVGIVVLIAFSIFSSKGASIMAFTYASFGLMGSFAGLPFTLLFNNSKSKWERFELTAPVTRVDVIKSRYISFLLFSILGMIAGGMLFLSSSLVSNVIDWPMLYRGVSIGSLMLVLTPAIMHPMILKFGIEKGQAIFMLSVALSLGLYAAPSFVFSDWLSSLANQEFVNSMYNIATVTLSFIIFFISYFVSVKIYSKKDL